MLERAIICAAFFIFLFPIIYLCMGGVIVCAVVIWASCALMDRIKDNERIDGSSYEVKQWKLWRVRNKFKSVLIYSMSVATILASMVAFYFTFVMGNNSKDTSDATSIQESIISEDMKESSPQETEIVHIGSALTGEAIEIISNSGDSISVNKTITISDASGKQNASNGDKIEVVLPATVTVSVSFSYNNQVYSEETTTTFDKDDWDNSYGDYIDCAEASFLVPLTVFLDGAGNIEEKYFPLNYNVWVSTSKQSITSEIEKARTNSQYVLASALPDSQPYCGIWVSASDYLDGSSNKVGNEWSITHYASFDGKNYVVVPDSGAWYSVDHTVTLYVKTVIVEDDKYPDESTNRYSIELELDRTIKRSGSHWTINQWTDVVENNGAYRGNSCTWNTDWTITFLYN